MPTFKIAISDYSMRKKIPAQDPFWPKFNSSFVNYDAEPEQIAKCVFEGHALTTQHKDKWRVSSNYICGQHIGLDFDNGDISSSIDHLKKDKFISKYASFLYTTISHTIEVPRARVIFLLDKPIMQPGNYSLAATALLWLFGTADRQCKDCVRFFYGSPNCQMEIIGNILPLETIKHLISEYQDTGKQEKKKSIRPEYSAPPSQQEVHEALKLINPWGIDYGEWVQVLMGIHAEFGDAGKHLAESWAKGEPGEVERKWHSFKNGGESMVTIATVFGIAKRFGWHKGV